MRVFRLRTDLRLCMHHVTPENRSKFWNIIRSGEIVFYRKLHGYFDSIV
jgi:hypothetical protein